MSAFATPTELESYIGGQAGTPTPRDTFMLDLAAAQLRRWTGQTLTATAGRVEAVPIPWRGIEQLLLEQRPVTAVTTVLVDGTAATGFTFTRWGRLALTAGWWGETATVTYDHGFTEADPEWETLKLLNLMVAARAVTYYKNPRFEELGGAPSETAGFAPEMFLTVGEQKLLADLGKVPVG